MTTGPQGRIYDEFAKLMNDAAGLAQSAGREVSSAFRAQGERFASELDLVRREDLEVVQEIAAKALAEVEKLSAHWDWMRQCDSACGYALGQWKWRHGGKVPLTGEEEAAWRDYARRHDLLEDPSQGLEAYAREYHRLGPPWPRIRIYLLDRRGRILDHIAVARTGAVPKLQVVGTDRRSIEFSLFSPSEVFRLRILDRPRLTWLPRPFWHAKLGWNWMVVEHSSLR